MDHSVGSDILTFLVAEEQLGERSRPIYPKSCWTTSALVLASIIERNEPGQNGNAL